MVLGGMLAEEDAFALIAERSRLMGEAADANPGVMSALLKITLPEAEALCAQCAEGEAVSYTHLDVYKRQVIDGRGSIDSRTFNESHQISAYSRDDRDRHDPMIDTMDNRAWYSRAGQGFATPAEGAPGAPAPVRRPRGSRASDVGFAGVMSGSANYGGAQGGSGVPLFVKVAVPLIVVLLVVIVCLLVF